MAWSVEVVAAKNVQNHPNADKLDILNVGDYVCITSRDRIKEGDLVAYIPEQSLLPDELVEEMGLKGMLASGNRVKPKRLRGIFSQGLVYPARPDWTLGQDVAEELGVKKWNPEDSLKGGSKLARLLGMSNEVFFAYPEDRVVYDIPNFKKERHAFEDNVGLQDIIITEKIHGSLGCFQLMSPQYVYDRPKYHDEVPRGLAVASKGRLATGVFLRRGENKEDIWWKVAERHRLEAKAENFGVWMLLQALVQERIDTVKIFGEIYGHQDLKYDAQPGQTPFAVFDIYIGEYGKGRWLDWGEMALVATALELDCVPVLYLGKYDRAKIEELTDGRETVSASSTGMNIREGVVVKTYSTNAKGMSDRLIVKSVSESYLTRGGEATEFH
jgi:RNA ligase (TIGR02306 family)